MDPHLWHEIAGKPDASAPKPRRQEPHRGDNLLRLGLLGLLIVPVGVYVFFQAWGDLSKMNRGVMDPAGRGKTRFAFACGGVIFSFVCLLLIGPPVVIAINELRR